MKAKIILILLLVLFLTAVFGLPIVGRIAIFPFGEISRLDSRIYWEFRFPRTLLALLAGGGLAVAGAVFQAIFRNPLATPYTLGIASGASFGASLYIRFSGMIGFVLLGISGISWFALLGAGFAMSIVYLVSRLKKATPEQMLLAGVAVNFFFASLILLLQYISDPANAVRMLRWTMGGLTDTGIGDVARLAPVVLISAFVFFVFSRELNILLTGEERAAGLGIAIGKFRAVMLLICSVLIGAIVALCGPIGFIGLMAPHLCRLLLGPDHRLLIPGAFLFGAVFLALCDTFARSVLQYAEIPVGIISSLLGGPFFLWLLMRSKR